MDVEMKKMLSDTADLMVGLSRMIKSNDLDYETICQIEDKLMAVQLRLHTIKMKLQEQ